MIDKFQASMLGYAIGDALAAPIEDVVRYPDEGEEICVIGTFDIIGDVVGSG